MRSFRHRLVSSLALAIAIAAAAVSPVAAQGSGFATTSDPLPWGVVDRVSIGVDDDQELIRDIAISGDTVYTVGFFLNVQPTGGGSKVSQPFVAAFDRTTGAWKSAFTPSVNGPVLEVEVDAQGQVYIGGDFTSVNGSPSTSGVAVLDGITGAPTSTKINAEWAYNQGQMSIDALTIEGDMLYVGGNLTHLTTNASGRVRVNRLARVQLANAAIDRNWNPTVSGGRVATIALDTSRNRVYVGGQFTGVNGTTNTYRFVTLDEGTGGFAAGVPQGLRVSNELYPVHSRAQSSNYYYYRYSRQDHFPYDIEVFPGYVAWAGDMAIEVMSDSNLNSVYSWNRRSTLSNNCPLDGDVQALEYTNGYLYWAGHFEQEGTYFSRNCATSNPRVLARWSAQGGRDTNFTTQWNQPSPSVWALQADPTSGALWVGGFFSSSGNVPVRSLARFTPGGPPVADTERPSVPTGLSVDGATDTSIDLSWNTGTDNVGVTGYYLYRSTNPSQLGPLVGTSSTTSFTDADAALRPSTTYYYALKAFDAAGNLSYRSGFRAAATADPGVVIDTERPSTPSNVSVGATTATTVSLGWTASTDNIGVTGYEIYRSTSPGTVGPLVATTSTNSFTDTGLTTGTTYYYALKAYDAAGNTSWRTGLREATTN